MEKHEKELANMQDVYKALYTTLVNLNIDEDKIVTEDTDTSEKDKTDEKLEQILDDLYESAKLLEDKFQKLKDDTLQLQKTYSNEDEYGKIQSSDTEDSLLAARNNIINLGKLFQYFTKYLTKYGFKDVNKSNKSGEQK